MSALGPSTNLRDTKSSVSVLHPGIPFTSVIAAGCNITHTAFTHEHLSSPCALIIGPKVRWVQNKAMIFQGTGERFCVLVLQVPFAWRGAFETSKSWPKLLLHLNVCLHVIWVKAADGCRSEGWGNIYTRPKVWAKTRAHELKLECQTHPNSSKIVE